MRRLLAAFLIGVSLLTSTTAQDQERIADLSPDSARISRGAAGGLTPPSALGRQAVVADFLRRGHGHDEATASSLVLGSQDPTSLRVHLRFRQRIAGLEVYGTYVKATLGPGGEVLSVIENLAPARAEVQPALIDYRDALVTALRHRYPGDPTNLQEIGSAENVVTYGRGSRFSEDPTVTRVIVPLQGARLRVGYVVETWDRDNQLWHTVVGGRGRVLHETSMTASEQYRIFWPNPSTPSLIYEGPGAGYVFSPAGWKSGNTTTGNNVDAYLDTNNDNVPDDNGRPLADVNGSFLTAADLTQAPSAAVNKAAAVQNLFMISNFAHDILWVLGFNEANGNFQENNFGLGGLGSDSVNAEAQDGSAVLCFPSPCFNNANFSTPFDGSNPRMQMYLWTQSTPNRDGSLDADIILHEYGHGLTNRMVGVGGMSGTFAGAVGEGFSDALAVFLTGDDAVAEYSRNNANGIRSARYLNMTKTYANMSQFSGVHTNGEIFGMTMTRLLLLWLTTGRNYVTLLLDTVEGLNYTPLFPAFEDMRDGLLAAMNARGATLQDRCVVWDAFASAGIGFGADGSSPPFSITASSARAPECAGVPSTWPPALTQASINRLPRARLAADIQTALRHRGFPTAKTALTVLAPAALRQAQGRAEQGRGAAH